MSNIIESEKTDIESIDNNSNISTSDTVNENKKREKRTINRPLIKFFINKNFYEAPKNNNYIIIIFLSDHQNQKDILKKGIN
jgi:hypothetical protein